MTNNDILRRLRYTFDLSDSKVIKIFALGDLAVTREQISEWLKQDDDIDYKSCNDEKFSNFLDGFIIEKRGPKIDSKREPVKKLNNNIIFNKLKIALNLKAEEVIEILESVDFSLSKHELSAFFRNPTHKHFRACQDQVLRNFLNGLQIKFRDKI